MGELNESKNAAAKRKAYIRGQRVAFRMAASKIVHLRRERNHAKLQAIETAKVLDQASRNAVTACFDAAEAALKGLEGRLELCGRLSLGVVRREIARMIEERPKTAGPSKVKRESSRIIMPGRRP